MDFPHIFNPFGMAFSALLILPHIIYRRKHTIDKEIYTNKAMYYIDRMGRFFSLLLMSFHTGVLERGFTEPKELMERFWIISTAVMLLIYLLLWALFLKKERKSVAYLIAAASTAVIVFSGILQVNTLLFTAGFIYLAGELYIIKRHFNCPHF